MLTRREFLKRSAVVGGGVAAGLGTVTLGRRLLTTSNGGGGITEPGHEFDEEFNGPNTDWTVAGSNDVSFNDAVPGNVFMKSGMVIHRASIPAFPFTVTAFASNLEFNDIYSQFGASMLCVGGSANAATTGPKFYAIQWDVAFLGEIGIIDGTYDNYTTQVHQNTYIKLSDDLEHEIPHYLRLTVNSPSSISSYWSEDGENWETFLTNYNPGLGVTIDSVLLCSFACEVAYDWLRFT